jgi:hypothetical protein
MFEAIPMVAFMGPPGPGGGPTFLFALAIIFGLIVEFARVRGL